MKRIRSPKFASLLDDVSGFLLQDRAAALTAMMPAIDAEDSLFKWKLAYNATLITALREYHLWPMAKQIEGLEEKEEE